MLRALRKCYIPIPAQDTLLRQHWRALYTPTTAKNTTHVETRTESSESDSNMLWRKRFTSQFGRREAEMLRMQIICKDTFPDAMGINELTDPPPPSVTDLYLDGMGPFQILFYNPDDYPKMSKGMHLFLDKLNAVAINSPDYNTVSRRELLIDDMTNELMQAIEFNDGYDLTMASCDLDLSVGQLKFAANADREARRGRGIIWAMQENKHFKNSMYRKGDIQLISCMIAAYQDNAKLVRGLYPEIMMGIKIIADEFFFYSMKMTDSYRNDLLDGEPNEDIEIFKYPSDKIGLRISVPEERKLILNHLWSMRCYAVKLDKIQRLFKVDALAYQKWIRRTLTG